MSPHAHHPRPERHDHDERERGATLVVAALVLVALLAMTALVVDIAYAKQERRETQNAADAAALAAAQELDGETGQVERAVAAAMDWAAENLDGLEATDWLGCQDDHALAHVPPGAPSAGCVTFDSATAPTTVRVRVPDVAPAFFGQVFGRDGYDVTSAAAARRAQATATGGAPASPCGLCIIEPGRLQIAGVQGIHVEGGEIQAHQLTANSSDSLPASAITPLPLRWFQNNNSNWGRNVQPAPATFNSRYERLTDRVPNPFASVTVTYPTPIPANSTSNLSFCHGWNQGQALQPNVMYAQSVNISCGTVTLAPGTYYFAGNLQVNSGATLRGTGVTLVFGCRSGSQAVVCNNQEGGKLNFSSGSTVDITAPTAGNGPYPGFGILFDPGNRSGTPNQLSGAITIGGAIYAKQAGFNVGSSSAVVRAWTIVAGGTFDANNGTLLIDNTKLGGNTTTSGPAALGTEGAITLVQ